MGRPTPRQWVGLACGAAALALGLEWWIVTDREAIEAQLARLGAAMEAKAPDAALAVFADDFRAGPLDHAGFSAVLAAACSTHAPRRVAVERCATTVDGNRARTEVEWAVVAIAEDRGIPGALTVTLDWRRTLDGWRIASVPDDAAVPVFNAFGQRLALPPESWLARASRRSMGY